MTIEELNECCLYNVNNGIRITEKGCGRCRVEVTITDTSKNPYGTVHGGLLYSACDTAACIAGYDGGLVPVTQSSNLIYVRPGRGEKIYVEAACSYSGKNSCVSHVDVYSETGELLATGEFVFVRTSREKVLPWKKENEKNGQ